MKIKELIRQDEGLRYAIESMEFMSAAGRLYATETDYMTTPEELEREWEYTARAIACVQTSANQPNYKDLQHCLMQLHDLHNTILTLGNHGVMSEVELFEIKHLAFVSNQAQSAIKALGLADLLALPDLSEVFSMLDPDHVGTSHFYIYSTYDPRLAPLRQQLKIWQERGDETGHAAELFAQQEHIEQEVCTRLSDQLYPFADAIAKCMKQMAYTDYLMAKAKLCVQWELSRPVIGKSIAYEKLFNPRLKHHNEAIGVRYQPIDVSAGMGTTLITGANMAGKTMILKSLATAQLMVQCGFFAPAEKATIEVFDRVEVSVGDGQNEMNGLSSYASEMIRISQILQQSRMCSMLILIDEPARTTNPIEGKAIVKALVEILQKSSSTTLITTHYSGLGVACRRLRVRGFEESLSTQRLTPLTINQFIDYSLEEDVDDEVPQEALRIATILGCDTELIALAQKEYQQSNNKSL